MAAETRFHTLLKEKVRALMDLRKEELALGSAKDVAEYRQQVGYFTGLADALKLAEEIEREFDKS